MTDILSLSTTQLVKAYQSKSLSPSEVVKNYIARIKSVNPTLNAVVEERFAEAMKEAELAERKIKNGEARLLEGIPFTLKETISARGFHSTYGSKFRKNNIALKDAPVVANLKREGAILLGMTNTPECCFWMETYNKIYGKTNNPYDLSRTPGGSSGGEGAIIAAGGAPFGVGSDVAGSIRMPSAFCGIYGLAPSAGTVSVEGHYPYDFTSVRDFPDLKLKAHLKIGPMARKAEDLWPLLNVFAGKGSRELMAENLFRKDWKKNKILLLDSPDIKFASSVSPEIGEAMKKAASFLEEAGAEIVQVDPRIFYNIFEIWQTLLHESTDLSLSDLFGNGKEISAGKQALKMLAGKADITLPGLTACVLEKIMRPSEAKTQKLLQEARMLKDKVSDMLGKNGLLLMPVHPVVAPKHNHSFFKPLNWIYTTVFNALGNPAISIPAGLNSSGLPLAVQIAGNIGNDRLCCEAAVFLDSKFKPQTLKMEVGV